MKAVVLKEVGVLEVQDIPEPEAAPHEIKVKIAYAGICGSDPEIIEGRIGRGAGQEPSIGRPQSPPAMRNGIWVVGHEASGVIVQIGSDIRGDFKLGQRVAMNFRSVCGACYYCTNRMEHFCEREAPYSGAMAEYSVYRENTVFPLPDDVPLDIGAFLEPVSVAVHTLDISHMKVGYSVIITGGGSIGLLILQLAMKSGASKVLVSEPVAEKRQLAKQLGADVVVDPMKEDLLEISKKVTDGRGYNVCFETSGKPTVARQLILLAERGGAIVWTAVYPQNLDVGVPICHMNLRELSIHSVRLAPYSFPRAVQMLPKLDLKPLITVYPLKEVVRAFEAHKMGKGVKIMLQP